MKGGNLIGKTAAAAMILGGAAAMTLAGMALGGAAQAAPWKSMSTGDGTQYRIGNEIRNSFVIHCGKSRSSGTWIDMTVLGERLPALQVVSIEVGPQRFELEVNQSGRIAPATKDADRTFDRFWDALRQGSMMTVNYPNGLAGSFTLRGTTQAMPSRACPTDYDRP